MGNKNHETVNKHHTQVDESRRRKAGEEESRRVAFVINRANIKVQVETDRQYIINCFVVFLTGLMLLVFGLAYIAGVILYG